MSRIEEAQATCTKEEHARREFVRLLEAASTRGFYGTASLSLVVQDGHIQQMRVSTERMVK